MAGNHTYISNSKIHVNDDPVKGKFVNIGKERYIKITGVDAMPPFLMSIVSNTDHWMYISSNGGLTAGRKNPDYALFPYYTDDKILESNLSTGSQTIFRVLQGKKWLLWEPFSNHYRGLYRCSRNLYKSVHGNKIIFEEINHDLELRFRIRWMNSDKYGWIRESQVRNISENEQTIRILDGIRNILPAGIQKEVQEKMSTLLDAYKKTELEEAVNLGIFTMSSIPVDRAEPSEALRANIVWTTLKKPDAVLLSEKQVDQFRDCGDVDTEEETRGVRGAYYVCSDIHLPVAGNHVHHLVMDVYKDTASVIDLIHLLEQGTEMRGKLRKDVKAGTQKLISLVARADGIQVGGDERMAVRHYSNVMFNIMRGGIFEDGYIIRRNDFLQHLEKFNRKTLKKYAGWLKDLPEKMTYQELLSASEKLGNPEISRLTLEFLPLSFSRRHGDPSRPWNRFSIDIRNEDGSRSLSYQGNWRDIFQNWEALAYSYPGFLPNMIVKFLNASTADGYNPYRITDKGVDWEIFEPEDPWSFIGYWGDHQVIYLTKLLELNDRFFPGSLAPMINSKDFVFTNVPYRIKAYADILKDPHDTISFNQELHNELMARYEEIGADGKLLTDLKGQIIHASLAGKLLIPMLTKISNLIPGAGIWMNTQRPEWNDANNALVGNGVSMVTLYYLRRYVIYLKKLFAGSGLKELDLSTAVSRFLKEIKGILDKQEDFEGDKLTDRTRKRITDKLGKAGENYRNAVYQGNNSERGKTSLEIVLAFLDKVIATIDSSIALNKRDDNLYHTYNLVSIDRENISIMRLPLMLEGQVAFLSSGYAGIEETNTILDSLKNSKLYRNDQESYVLYPDRDLPRFVVKNSIIEREKNRFPVLEKLCKSGKSDILRRDQQGDFHFNGDIKNAGILKERLLSVKTITKKEKQDLLDLYEELFNHKSFTGRSGSFFKYEGLGSIYWHMVSKLQLAVAENIIRFSEEEEWNDRLKIHYNEIKEGIGLHKNPARYGAFPVDPYSHTPSMLGVQQPGMTGQVKEDIISRWFELGVEIKEGKVTMNPHLVQKPEFDDKGELSFSFCGIPVLYSPNNQDIVEISLNSGEAMEVQGLVLDNLLSSRIFQHDDTFRQLRVGYKL